MMGRVGGCIIGVGLGLFGCGGDGREPGDDGADVSFEAASMKTLPVFGGVEAIDSQTAVLGALPALQPGVAADEIRFMFLDPEPYEADGTSLGVQNVYHLLADMDGAMSGVPFDACAGTSGIDHVPFFDDHASDGFFTRQFTREYGCSANGGRSYGKADGTTYDGLYLVGDANGSSVYQGSFDEASGALQLRLSGIWGAADEAGHLAMRVEFEGNAEEHRFTLRLTKYSDGGYYVAMLGAGVSRGLGGHFLMMVRENHLEGGGDGALTLGDRRFFCYSTDDLVAVDDTDVIHTTSSCREYEATVESMTWLLHQDLPREPFDVAIDGTEPSDPGAQARATGLALPQL